MGIVLDKRTVEPDDSKLEAAMKKAYALTNTDKIFAEACEIKLHNPETFKSKLKAGHYKCLETYQQKVLADPTDMRRPEHRGGRVLLKSPCGWVELVEDRTVFGITTRTFDESKLSDFERKTMNSLPDDPRLEQCYKHIFEGGPEPVKINMDLVPDEFFDSAHVTIETFKEFGCEVILDEWKDVWGQGDGQWNHFIVKSDFMGSVMIIESTVEGQFIIQLNSRGNENLR